MNNNSLTIQEAVNILAQGGSTGSTTAPVAATATGSITTQNLNPASGVATAGSTVAIGSYGAAELAIQVTGTYTGALSIQISENGTDWVTAGGGAILNYNTGAATSTIASAATGIFTVSVAGSVQARVTALAAMTGTAVVTVVTANKASQVAIDSPIPAGANSIGTVVLGSPATSTTTSGFKAEDAVHATGDVGVMPLGVRYEALTAPASAAGDYAFVNVDDLSKTISMPYTSLVNQVQGITAAMTGTASTSVIASGGASVRNYVTSVTVTNTHATVGTEVDILDGATILDRIYVPALKTESRTYPVPLKGTAATAINAQNVTTGSNTYVQATGFKAI